MSLIHATYTPSGTVWQRIGLAIVVALVNMRVRFGERRDEDFYVQVDRMDL